MTTNAKHKGTSHNNRFEHNTGRNQTRWSGCTTFQTLLVSRRCSSNVGDKLAMYADPRHDNISSERGRIRQVALDQQCHPTQRGYCLVVTPPDLLKQLVERVQPLNGACWTRRLNPGLTFSFALRVLSWLLEHFP